MSYIVLRSGDVGKNSGPAAIAATINETQIKKNKLLTAIYVNAHSLLRHYDDLVSLASLASAERPHIIAVSETWLDSSVSNSEIHLAGYNLFRFVHNRSGGGVAVYCRNYLPCTLLHCATSSSGVESLWVSVGVGCFHLYLAFGCFYRLPAAPSQSVHDVCDNVESMMLKNQHIIACSGFNIDMSDLTNLPPLQYLHPQPS